MTSGANSRSAETMPSRVSTRRNVQKMSARRTSRSASAASCGSSSIIRMRIVAGIAFIASCVRGPITRAVRADPVAELRVGALTYVGLDRVPPSLFRAYALAARADRQNALEDLHLRHGGLQLA